MGTSRATLSRSRDREGWCAIFRHPARLDEDGRPLRVRRGLGTRDEAEAAHLVAQLNQLIIGPEWHSPAARERAAKNFHERVVAIFFDSMVAEAADGWSIREEVIPLPSADDGFARVLVCGSTGAGKTTFVRQLIGTDPDSERFPSTSTAKTTVADLEVVLRPGTYKAAVSFFSREKVRAYIEECVSAAIGVAAEGADDRRIASYLLEHHEQRFRLSYLLGTLADEPTDADEDWGDTTSSKAGGEITSEDRLGLQLRLQQYLSSLREVGEWAKTALSDALAIDASTLDGSQRDAFLELLEEHVADERCQLLIDEILDDVEARFSLLDIGSLERSRSGWPTRWVWETDDRESFLRRINRLSSNYASNFGRLLTPLVQGIRVAAPFAPEWHVGEPPKLVILDGEGLGHTSESVQSLPTAMTRRFSDVHVIALVDNAAQPMLAGPAAVLRSVSAMGHDAKLIIAFTHFDEVKGANIQNNTHRTEHVRRSLENAVSGLDKALGSTTVRGLRRNLEGRVVFLAGIDRRLAAIPSAGMRKFTTSELNRFVELCASSIQPPAPVEARPLYDSANLVLAVASATSRFQLSWAARLGVEHRMGVRPEHWTRIKALTRRFAEWDADQYDDMRPVADFLRELAEGLANFIAAPRTWTPENTTDELKQVALEAIRQSVSARLHDLTARRMKERPLVDWRNAFHQSGAGSARRRAHAIWQIYTSAAPRMSEVPTVETGEFIDAMRGLFEEAVQAAGGLVK